MFSRPSQCCYVRQNIVMNQCVFKVSAFGFNACTKTCAPLSDCCINNALIRYVPGYVHAVTRRCPWSASCRPSLALRTTPYSRPDSNSDCLLSKTQDEWTLGSPLSAVQLSHEPYGLAHCLVETCKSLTVDECLAEVFASVDLLNSIDR